MHVVLSSTLLHFVTLEQMVNTSAYKAFLKPWNQTVQTAYARNLTQSCIREREWRIGVGGTHPANRLIASTSFSH